MQIRQREALQEKRLLFFYTASEAFRNTAVFRLTFREFGQNERISLRFAVLFEKIEFFLDLIPTITFIVTLETAKRRRIL